MAIKRFETQDGIIIRPDDDIVNQNDQSLLGGGAGNSASITLTGKIPYVDDLLVDEPVLFTRPNNSPNTVDPIDTGLTLKRGVQGALYNSAGNVETQYNSNVSPLGTEWNADGWGDLADVKTRKYSNFTDTVQLDTWLAAGIHHKELVMHDTINDKYYTFKFYWWQPNGGNGSGNGINQKSGFTYVRQLINTDPTVRFIRPASDPTVFDPIDTGLAIKRDTNGGIFNEAEDTGWDADVTPTGTLWNDEGWDDFTDITARVWKPFFIAVHGRLGNEIVGRKLLMHDTINNKYYVVMFTEWGSNNGGSFAYWRRQIHPTGTNTGITFADGTKQTTAYNPGNIEIVNNTIKAIHNTSINIETTSDPLINADINIMSSDDINLQAQGGEGFYAQVDNNFTIEAGGTQFRNYSPGNTYWVASTIVIPNLGGDIGRSLQLYQNDTWNIDFRLDTGEWKGINGTTNVNSIGNAIYDAEFNNWTIPINIDNTGDPILITDIRLRDPDYTGSTYWIFNREGCLLPSWKTLDSHVAFQGQSNPTLQLGQRGQNVTITQAPTNENSRGNNAIRIQGQRGYGTYSTSGDGGYGGNIQIYGGLGGETGDRTIASGGEGGYVEIFGGDGQHGRNGGYLYLQAGDARMSDGNANNVHGGNVDINAGSAVDSIGTGLGSGGSVNISAGQGNAAGQHGRIQLITTGGNWQFTQTGEFKNNNTYTKTLETDLQGQSVTQVVWTSTQNWISGAKLLIQVESEEIGDTTGWHSQVCEAVIASRGYANGNNGVGEPVMTVYGVTHTSSVPLVTFTVQRNPATKNIEVVATRTAAVALSSTANLRVYSVETSTRD